MPLSSVAVQNRSSTAHYPQVLGQCIARIALPTAPRQWGSALQGLHCPLPLGNVAVHCRSPALKATTASWARLPVPQAG